MRRLEKFGACAGGNSLRCWWKMKNPAVVAYNFTIITLAKYCPSLRLKNEMLKLTGMRIGKGTRIGLSAMFDIFFPEKISIGENCIIGYNSAILAHEFLIEAMRAGDVKIGSNVLIGANSTVLAGVEIGDGAVVSAMTLVNGNVPANFFAEGVPMRVSRKK